MAVLHYRFYSEKAGFRQLPLDSDSISVADLKVLIAERNGLGREFARKMDLRLFQEDEKQEYKDDCQLVQAYSKVVVQRTAWMVHQDIQHKARTALTSNEWKTAEERKLETKKKHFPPEFLCLICSYVISQPMLVKCTGNCGLSACRNCIQKHIQTSKTCPFCKSGFRAVIRNKRLEQLLNNLNLDEFDCPKRSVDQPSFTSDTVDDVFSGLEVDADNEENVETQTRPQVPSYFIYLLNSGNLNLLRRYDMMVVEILSNLACALFNGDSSSETFVIPCAPAGGGTSYAFGGFIRLSSLQRVEPATDPTAEELMKQWEINGQKKGVPQSSVLYRVNWLEKYGKMPMLPSRKQPLYGLLGNQRRQRGAEDNSRLQLEGALEVHLEKEKYEEVSTCIQDYIKFGSRPTEPFQYPSGASSNSNNLGMLNGDSIKIRRASNSRDESCRGIRASWCSASNSKASLRSSRQGDSHSLSRSSCYSETGDSPSRHKPLKSRLLNSSTSSMCNGPTPMGLNGNVDFSNPYLGYCAILPFLTVEQFKHVRKLQRTAKKKTTNENNFSKCSDGKSNRSKHKEILDESSYSGSSDSNSSDDSTHSSRSLSSASFRNDHLRSHSRSCGMLDDDDYCSANEKNVISSDINKYPTVISNSLIICNSDKGSSNAGCSNELKGKPLLPPLLSRQDGNVRSIMSSTNNENVPPPSESFEPSVSTTCKYIELERNLVKNNCLNNAGLIV